LHCQRDKVEDQPERDADQAAIPDRTVARLTGPDAMTKGEPLQRIEI